MVPKGDSQWCCYENEEQTYGERNGTKEKDEETRSGVTISRSFVNGWSQKNQCIQISGFPSPRDELIPRERAFIFVGNSSRPKYKETQEWWPPGRRVNHGADLISEFKVMSTKEAEDSWTFFMIHKRSTLLKSDALRSQSSEQQTLHTGNTF